MKIKPLTFLLALTFLFLFSSSVFSQETEVKKEYWENGKLKSEIHCGNYLIEAKMVGNLQIFRCRKLAAVNATNTPTAAKMYVIFSP